jgi:predicted GNAT family acetyltransferase
MTHEIRNAVERSRYELFVDEMLAGFAAYHEEGDAVVLPQTVVKATARGQGLGEVLIRGVLDDVRSRGLSVIPACSFVQGFIEQHEEYQDLLAA